MKIIINYCILFMICYLWQLHRFPFKQILLQPVKIVLIIISMLTVGCAKYIPFTYPTKKQGHTGGDLTPFQAYKMATENKHVFIVDTEPVQSMFR